MPRAVRSLQSKAGPEVGGIYHCFKKCRKLMLVIDICEERC